MLKLNLFFIFFAIKVFFLTMTLSGQCSEKTAITTDRDIYFSGETLWYKLNCLKSETNQPSGLSRVAYLELLNIKSTPILQFKLNLDDGKKNSRITIPDTLSTGNYIVRTYTNWMKNFGYEIFSSKVISVINPFQKNVFAYIDKLYMEASEYEEHEMIDPISVRSVKSEYKTRSLVELNLENATGLSNISVSVAKQTLIAKKNISSEKSISQDNSIETSMPGGSKFKLEFLPEIEGEIISGTIRNKSDNTPLVNQVLTLGFTGRDPSLYLSRTDSSGKFRFVVNQFGLKEMVIQPLSADTTNIDFLIDIDPAFTASSNNLQFKAYMVDDQFIDGINKCIVSMQVEAIYNSVSKRNQIPVPAPWNYCFYGVPEFKVTLERYIELPTLSEVFKEIVPMVAVKDRANNNLFRVIGPLGTIKKSFAMVDGIYIKDVNRIVDMNPEDIKQIEVVNLTYYLQDQELGAIISIQTKKGDLSAIDFDNRIFRREFTGYDYTYRFSSPDYSVDSLYSSPVADFRNLLYWNPDVRVDDKGSGLIKFYTSDDSGKYLILLEGIDPSGRKKLLEIPFSVVD
jgi:hypothetical protein